MSISINVPVAVRLAAVTASDDTVLNCQGLYVGGTGDLALQAADQAGTTVTLQDIPAGTFVPIACYKVMAATTATNIVALFV